MAVYKLSAAGGVGTARTNYNSFLAGNPAYVPPSYYSIQTATVDSGGASSITFTSIPNTYKHLQIRGISKATGASTDSNIQINSSTNAVYRHQLFGNGSSVSGAGNANNAYIIMTTGSSGTSIFDTSIIDFLDYTSTNKNKVVRALSGRDLNGSGLLSFGSALWTISSSAISDITLVPAGTSFAQYTQFALYGVK